MNEDKSIQKKDDMTSKVIKVGATTVLGAAIGVAGGFALVTIAAFAEGAALSTVVAAKVLGTAGGAAGLAKGVSAETQKKKKKIKVKKEN